MEFYGLFVCDRNDPRLFKDDVDIRFSRTLNSCKLPQIRYASPERLYERLTDLRFLSIDFLNTFLLTYRVFTDSITVIEALKRVHYNPELQLSSMSASLHDSSGSLDEMQASGVKPSTELTSTSTHLHPHQSPHHPSNLLNIHMPVNNSTCGGNVAAANDYLSTTIDYDYSRRVSNSSVLSDINELGHRESIVSTSDSSSNQPQAQQMFNASSGMIRNSQHWRLSYRKCLLFLNCTLLSNYFVLFLVLAIVEEEQARERYLKRMNNRNMHGSVSSTASSASASNDNYIQLPAGEPMFSQGITDPISVPTPPPPSPEVPGYILKEMSRNAEFVSRLIKIP